MKKVSEFFRLIDTLPPLVFSLMVLSVVAMNLLANKSIDTGLTWLALDCGILFSWLCFLAMDIMTHCYGPKAATAGSLAAMGINLLMCSGFFVGQSARSVPTTALAPLPSGATFPRSSGSLWTTSPLPC